MRNETQYYPESVAYRYIKTTCIKTARLPPPPWTEMKTTFIHPHLALYDGIIHISSYRQISSYRHTRGAPAKVSWERTPSKPSWVLCGLKQCHRTLARS